MTSLLLALGRLIRACLRALEDEEFRALLVLTAVLLLAGTVFYHRHEGWNLLDSAFFSLITLTTVGYGDLVPSTPLSKIFTMVYLVLGISVLLGFINKVAGEMVRHRTRRSGRRGEGGKVLQADSTVGDS